MSDAQNVLSLGSEHFSSQLNGRENEKPRAGVPDYSVNDIRTDTSLSDYEEVRKVKQRSGWCRWIASRAVPAKNKQQIICRISPNSNIEWKNKGLL